MRSSRLAYALVYLFATLAGTASAASAGPTEPPAESAVGRWFRATPGWGCGAAARPAAYQVNVPIGSEVDAFIAAVPLKSEFTDASISDDLLRVGASYDPVHRIGFFSEHGTDIGHYYVTAGVGAPPVAVKERNLATLAMGGKVHLGDTLEAVRSAFNLKNLRLTIMGGCAFPHAAEYGAVILYGPPHHPPVPAANNICRDVGPDIAHMQYLGYVIFRAGRVAVLKWDYGACAY